MKNLLSVQQHPVLVEAHIKAEVEARCQFGADEPHWTDPNATPARKVEADCRLIVSITT